MAADRQALCALLEPVMAIIAAAPWDDALAAQLNAAFPAGGDLFQALSACCDDGIGGGGDGADNGWMGLQGEEVRKGARVVDPCPETRDMSIDVVQLIDFAGPHHRHPNGEVCAIMADRAGGRFDGHATGWAVYPPGSDHWPAGNGGRVRILFFLPGGAIDYTDRAASLASGSAGGTDDGN